MDAELSSETPDIDMTMLGEVKLIDPCKSNVHQSQILEFQMDDSLEDDAEVTVFSFLNNQDIDCLKSQLQRVNTECDNVLNASPKTRALRSKKLKAEVETATSLYREINKRVWNE